MVKKIGLSLAHQYNDSSLFKNIDRGIIILCYHGVEKVIKNLNIQNIHIQFEDFKKQINFLKHTVHIEFISLSQLLNYLNGQQELDSLKVLITFDDGYKNNLELVAPYLQTLAIPFMVFVSTNHINSGTRFPTFYVRASIWLTEHKYIELPSIGKTYDINNSQQKVSAQKELLKIIKTVPQNQVEAMVKQLKELIEEEQWKRINQTFYSDEPMNWNDIKKIQEFGAIIGSHCHDHAIFHEKQSEEEINFQLKKSKEIIEDKLGTCDYFAFPKGGVDDITVTGLNSVKKQGFALGFSAVPGIITREVNIYALPRIFAPNNFTDFKYRLQNASLLQAEYQKWCRKFS